MSLRPAEQLLKGEQRRRTARGLPERHEDSFVAQHPQNPPGGRHRDIRPLLEGGGSKRRELENKIQRPDGVLGMRGVCDLGLHFPVEFKDGSGPRFILRGLGRERGEEIAAPRRPVSGRGDGKQGIVVGLAVLLKVGAHVEVRGRQNPLLHQKERDDHASETAIPIQKGVEGLEFRVDDGELHQPVRGLPRD